MAEIVLYKDGVEQSRFKLEARGLTIGRGPSNDIVLDDPRASRSHARILPKGGGFELEDQGSAHGTYVGEERVSRRLLRDGDRIRITDRTFLFRALADGAAASPGAEAPAAGWSQLSSALLSEGGGHESSARLNALFEMSVALEVAKDFPATLRALLDRALGIMGAERGFIMLKDQDSGKLKVHVARDRSGDIAGVEAESVSRSLMERVVQSGAPVLVGNAMGAEWGSRSMVLNKIHSALCVPLRTQKEVSGVLYVDHRSRVSAFTGQDLNFLTVFALQAKEAIDSSRAYWELVDGLFRASEDFVAVCGPDGRIRQANRGAQKLTGRSEAELAARAVPDLAAPEQRGKAEALCQGAMEKAIVSSQGLVFLGADGRRVPVGVSTFVMRDRAGAPLGFCLIGRDLSDLKSLIDRLTAANEKLRELNEMKSEFVDMITHELKSPLSVAVAYVDVMLEDVQEPPTKRQRDHLEHIQRSTERLIGLIAELLELTRIETGKIPLKPSLLAVRPLLEESVETLALSAKERRVSVLLDVPDGLPEIRADRALLRRAIDNFVSNGIKYNTAGKRLRISVERLGRELLFAFADEGIGISEEDLKSLFGRFFRGKNVGQVPGTGLGLSIVKAIVERHDGRLEVESVLGSGTTFRVRLPIAGPAGTD